MKIKFMLLTLLLTALASAQAPNGASEAAPKKPDVAVVKFVFDYDEIEPKHFEINVDETGAATYQSVYGIDIDVEAPTYSRTFQLSDGTRKNIFELVRAANYLNGNFDYTKSRISFSGKKTLSYKDATHDNVTSLNWSENKSVMELVDLFQGISGTLELGQRLARVQKHQRLGLNDELKTAESQAKLGWLRELVLIKDNLQNVADDPKVMDIARNRARRLLALVGNQ